MHVCYGKPMPRLEPKSPKLKWFNSKQKYNPIKSGSSPKWWIMTFHPKRKLSDNLFSWILRVKHNIIPSITWLRFSDYRSTEIHVLLTVNDPSSLKKWFQIIFYLPFIKKNQNYEKIEIWCLFSKNLLLRLSRQS